MNPSAVQVRNLTKSFESKLAVASIDLDVRSGSLFGLIGPNGAGKTTTLKMITALLRPDAGTVEVDGINVWANPVGAKAHFGVLPDDLRLFERLSGMELLSYVGRLRQLDPDVIATRVPELLRVLGLYEDRGKLVADYSQGMRKKIGLAAAMLHTPRVLFLDEPFESVDPVSAHTIAQLLQRFCAGGGTVVFSTHVLDVVERLCDSLAMINRGRVVAQGTMEQVRGQQRLEDVFVQLVGGSAYTGANLSWLDQAPAEPGSPLPPPVAR